MANEQHRWTVTVGGDAVTVERTPAGLVAVAMPARREAIGTRAEIRELRDALNAAIEGGE